MSSETASRRTWLGLAGVASLCCLAPGAVAATGGAASIGMGAGLAQVAVTVLTLGLIGLVIQWWTGCSRCRR